MSVAAPKRVAPPKGSAKPRIAPPTPARSDLVGYRQTATDMGISLMPWQETAARYLEARDSTDRHLYREVAVIVARQQGKTELMVPLIVKRLLERKRIIHTAQDRDEPRKVYARVAQFMWEHHRELFPTRNDRPTKPRYANGQEEIILNTGAFYKIVAPTGGGARGKTTDTVIVDELREMTDWDFIAGAKSTMKTSPSPQFIYLSNAGSEASVVLNAVRKRRDDDPRLAYIEWSAAKELAANDPRGWVQANPAIGHEPEGMGSILETLEDDYRTAMLEGTIGIFETENLCRWVISIRRRLVEDFAWIACSSPELEPPSRFALGVGMDPEGKRAAIVRAWRQKDDTIALQLAAQTSGEPFSVDEFGETLRKLAVGATGVAYDPHTDKALVRFVRKPKPEPVSGGLFSNASSRFTNLVNAGELRWKDADPITDDLGWTARKDEGDEGAYQAVRSDDDHPIPAALAAIRAVWLASKAKVPAARVWT